ncbi:MAG: hypothetical protein ACH255_21050, partial [Candidatus Thiodiazotropha sp.]
NTEATPALHKVQLYKFPGLTNPEEYKYIFNTIDVQLPLISNLQVLFLDTLFRTKSVVMETTK